MMNNFKNFFAFTGEPFPQDIKEDQLYPLPALNSLVQRAEYAIEMGALAVITGEVGSGKSTSLRYTTTKLHPSAYKIIPVIANTGSYLELLRQMCQALGIENRSHSVTSLTKSVRNILTEIVDKKQTPVFFIDEAHLLRLEVLAQLHTLVQFDFDSKPLLPVILSGQKHLIDSLMYHTSRPLASRVVGRTHMDGLSIKDMEAYLKHHLEIAGIKEQLFSDEAVMAIQQGSGGLLRKANLLARGSLISAASEKCHVVSPEHVRIASTELF